MTEEEASVDRSGPELVDVVVTYKKEGYCVPVDPNEACDQLFDFIAAMFAFKQQHIRLFVKGKQLKAEDTIKDAGIDERSKVLVVASREEEIILVQNSKSDPLRRGFDKGPRRKYEVSVASLTKAPQQDSTYRFERLEVLPQLSHPPQSEALRLLQRLATDPGIVSIMREYQWTVGVLCEMPPEGKVGEDPVCILGLNEGRGQKIHLRLRTDDLKGFRKYEVILNTLLHELTHNRIGPHNRDFYNLMSELRAHYMQVTNQFKSAGRTTGMSEMGTLNMAESGPAEPQDNWSFTATLGGAHPAPTDPLSLREVAAQAAERRHQPQPTSPIPPTTPEMADEHQPLICCDDHQAHSHEDRADKGGDTVIETQQEGTVESPAAPQEADQDMHEGDTSPIAMPVESDELQRIADATQKYVETLRQRLVLQGRSGGLEGVMREGWVLLRKLISNVQQSPYDDKYRRLRRSNRVLSEKVFSLPGFEDVLRSVGFEKESDDALVLRTVDPVKLQLAKEVLDSLIEGHT
ncbi:unnamed protein product [Vitrella brassicaformis CCMP3155]|uniref:WLM domain-containing protein n=2 Tax=Vitrella brassicaformis TaxID=1169539 RepID=A0A0G4FMT5_VITBC|nr:unnamed protein product [Vitrella brassicaformis CCMP3155]|eukprot:CEM15494.1 unnamed protein product [Vitrella brassicaformis CCMP3155]